MATFVKTTRNLFRTQRKDEQGSAGTRDKSKSGKASKASHKDRSVAIGADTKPPHSHMDSAPVQTMAVASPHPQPRSIQYTPPDRAQELDAVSARLQHEPDHTLVAPLTSLNLVPLGTRDKASEKVEPWVSQLRHNSYEVPEGMTGPYESRPTSCAVSLSPLSSASASGADDQRHPFAFAPGRALPFASLNQTLRDHQAHAPKPPNPPINAARPRSEVMSRGQPSGVHQALVAAAAQAAMASQHDFSVSAPRNAHEATVNTRGDKGMTKEAAPAVQGPTVSHSPIQPSNAEWQTMSKSKPPTQKTHSKSHHSGSQEARDRDAAHADALARLSGGKKRDSLEARLPKQKTKRHTYDTHATSTTYPSFGHIYHQDGRPIAPPPPPTQPPPMPPVPHVSAIHAAADTAVYGAGFAFRLADIAEGTQEGRTAYVETVPDASFRCRIVLTMQEDAPPRATSRAAPPMQQAAADAESDLLTESVLVRKLTLLQAAKAEVEKSLRSSKVAASDTGSDGSGRTTKAPPSMVPTTMTQVNNLVDNSSFHDETLCQLLDAARLNLIGDEAKKALMRAARTRVSELRDLKDKYEELDSVGPTTPLVIRKKGKKGKGRAKGDSAPPALSRERVVSDASAKTAKKTSTPPSLDLNIVPDEPRDATPEDNPSPATPRWATELLSRLGLLENRLTEVENLRGQQGMHASAAASPSILDEIIMGAGFPLGGMGSFAAYAPQFRNPFATELSVGGGASIHTIHSNAIPGAVITPLSPNATGVISPKNTAQAPPSPAPTVPADPSPVPNIQPLPYPMPEQGVPPGAAAPPGVNWPPQAPVQSSQAQAPSSQWTQWDAGQYQPPPPPTIPQQFPPMPPNPMPPNPMPQQQPWGQWDGCAYPPAPEMPTMPQVPPSGPVPQQASPPSAHQTPSRAPTQPPSLAPSRAPTQPSSTGSRRNDSFTTPQGPFINIIPPTATPTAPASRQSQSFSPAAPGSPENNGTPPGNAPPTLPATRETTPTPAPATQNVIQAIFERELPPLPSNVSIHLERARSERGAGSERGSAAAAAQTPRPASPTASQRTLRGSARPTSRVPVPPWCPPDVVPLRPSDVVTVVDPLCPPMPTPTPWEVISQRLYDMAMIWEVESFERALQQISLGQEVEAFALTIFAMMTFKRNLAHRLTASPPLVCDKLLVPPLAAQAINNALHAKRIGEAAQVLTALWTPVSTTSPRVLITLTKHVQRGWLASRYDLATGRLTTYHVAHYGAGLEPQDGSASASEPAARASRGSRLFKTLVPRRASLPPSTPPLTSGGFEWWHAIRMAWPDRKIPELLTQSVKPVTTDKHEDDSLRAAVVARNLLLGIRPEHEASLSGLREYVWTETKRLLVKKRQGKLVLRPEDEPEGTLTGDMWSSTQVISVGI